MKRLRSALCLVFLVLALGHCSSQRDTPGERTAVSTGALTGPTTFTIPLPPQVPLQALAAAANDTLLIDDRAILRTPAGALATVANLGSTQSNFGVTSQVGNVWSVAPVVLNDRAHVTGFIRSQGKVTVAPTATVSPGPVVANTPFTPLGSLSWSVTFPSPTGDVLLQPRATRTLQPGSFGALTVQPTAKLILTAGTYYFQSLDFESQAIVSLDDSLGPISIYVANSVIYRATVTDTTNQPASILIGFSGAAPVSIEAPFVGTFVAPAARVTAGSFAHRGAFFAKGLELLAGASLTAQAFTALPAIDALPSATVNVGVPVYLTARASLPGLAVPLTYQWSISSTPPNLRFHLTPNGDNAIFYGIDFGQFTATLVATDVQGRQINFNVPIHVLDSPMPDRPDQLDAGATQRPCRASDETLAEFSTRCDKAMGGVTVPAFDCEDPDSTEPPLQGNGAAICEAPNVLNTKCDPGSHFHVLHRNVNSDGIYVVAHCRHKQVEGNGVGQYGDVAVIQYNANSGATCFYQAFQTGLSRHAPAPSAGEQSYWLPPSGTFNINCARCHDSGPFIRSPYLAQLGQVWPFSGDLTNSLNPGKPSSNPPADKNALPGTLASDLAGPWNKTMPYGFVGLNFQSWEAYSLTNTADATCTGCHRMGVSKTSGNWNQNAGTAIDLGIRATNADQTSVFVQMPVTAKLPHNRLSAGVTSPIWMKPGQFTSNAATTSSALSMQTCGEAIVSGSTSPPAGCSAARFARGDTCPPPPTVVNGSISSTDPTSWKGSGKTPLGQPGGRNGFYFFTTIHGPFYQNSVWDPYMNTPPAVANPAWDPPTNAPSFRGTYLRIYVEPAGQWMLAWGLDATDIQNNNPSNLPPPGGPGGAIDSVAFDQIDSIPDPSQCGSNYHMITDGTGASSPQSITVDASAGASAAFLSGLIGNVSRAAIVDGGESGLNTPSYLQIFDSGSSTVFTQIHDNSPEVPLNQWFTAETWGNGCSNWQASAHYAVHGVLSYDDQVLVPAADVPNTICYIDGLAGDWSAWKSDGHGGSVQPYAQIYIDATTGYHLKVSPSDSTDAGRVGASATCLYLKK